MNQMTAKPDKLREKQVREAEELLFAGPQKLGVAKGLFLGRFVADWVMPYPVIPPEQSEAADHAVAELRGGAQPCPARAAPRVGEPILPERRRHPIGHERLWILGVGLWPRDGRAGQPVRLHFHFRQCPPLHRHQGAAVVRHARAKAPLASAAGARRAVGSFCAN